VIKALADSWRRYRALPALPRELVTFGLMLLVGLTVVPVATYIAGQVFLGDYIRDPSGTPVGGLGALWIDFVRGVFSGSMGYLLALLGPYLLLCTVRGMISLARHDRRSSRAPAALAPQPPKRDINQPLA
jgi:hypothetical protein